MKKHRYLIATGMLLAALAPLQTHAAANTWTGAGSSYWDTTTANWTSPTTWVQGGDAVFNATGAGEITLGEGITVSNMTFNAAGYQITGMGSLLTNSVVTAYASNNLAATISGPQSLTIQGTGTTVLLGDTLQNYANNFTGGTYVRGGNLILRAAGVNTSDSSYYGVGNIEAIDTGATVQIGTLNDGSDPDGGTSNIRPADGQILRGGNFGRLNLTGGTFDNRGDNNGIQYPPPEGTGTIINTSPYQRAVMKLNRNDGGTFVFNGQIKDGGVTITKTNGGPGYQQNIDMNGGVFTLVLGGSNSFTGFIRLSSGGTNNMIILTNAGTLGYPAPINCPGRQILMNSGTINLNGTSQKVGYVYTGNGADSIITNSAPCTVSTLTACYNCTNLVPYNGAATPRGIRCGLLDDPTTGGTLALTKEGVALQPIGVYAADVGSALPNNYHGDTTVNNGILQVLSTSGISPNSAYRLNTTQGKLQLDYAGTTNVRQLWINGVQQPNGVYGSAQTTAITGAGTITVTGYAPVSLDVLRSGNTLTFSWAGVYKLQSQTNSLNGAWFDYPGCGASPVNVTVDQTKIWEFFRLTTH